MSASQAKQNPAPAVDNEVELQSQPMDLASRSNPPLSGTAALLPTRVIAEAAKPIFLVKPAGSAGPTFPAVGISVPNPSAPSVVQPAPVAVPMARFQTSIRPGTLTPRVVPTTLVTASFANVSSHVPKGPAAVASIAIPRSAVASAAVIRTVPSTAPVSGFATRAVRPTAVTVRPGTGEAAVSGTWVTPATAVVQPPATIYKPAGPNVKTTTNLILAGHKPAAPSSISIIGQPKTPAPSTASNITLLSVRGSSNQPIVRAPTNPTLGPRPGPDVTKTTPTHLQTTTAQRTPTMTITSTSAAQATEKHFIKTIASSASAARPAGSVHIAARTVPAATALTSSGSVITANSGVTPVVSAGGLKNITPISTAVGKVGQQGIAVQFPQMTTKVGASPNVPVAGTRPGPANIGPVPANNAPSGNSRTYLVTTQAPTSTTIPIAKVLPQQVVTTNPGGNPPYRGDAAAGVVTTSEVHRAATAAPYLLQPSRPAPVESGQVSQPSANQPSTPSKLMGTSPRPSILRKRDYEGVPLKAQKNLTATLTMMTSTTSTPSTNSATTSIATTPAISPPSPRRLELTPGGPNGDSSRSSSGGSTTLSASSSPGIPPDMDESNPPSSITATPASIALGKALSSMQVKQEAFDNAETSGAIASLMRMGSVSVLPNPPELQMSPRKKPRKQQLLGQELQEVRSSDDEMPAAMNIKELKQESSAKSEAKEAATVVKRPRISLINSYRQAWKPRNQHFTRYSDVKLKDERRPTVTDLANQKQIMQKVHGWKVFHLTAQIEEMAYCESQVHERLSAVLEGMEKLGTGKTVDRDLMRVNELIKGNLQRSKVIQDGLEDSKVQVQKIFDHKPRAEEIIQRYMYKRLAKKREKT